MGGRFRANWQVGIDFLPNEWLDERDKSGTPTINKMVNAVERFRVGMAEHIYFVNNSPYGYPLEYEDTPGRHPPEW